MPRIVRDPNLWTAVEAARWSGIPYRALLALLRDGQVPCLRVGGPQTQNMGRGHKKRRRACGRYMVPRAAFVKWFESIPPAESRGQRRIA
jgi:hypothetical protein